MNGPLTKLGIVRTRDLVELYYTGRMVAISKNTQFLDFGSVGQLMTADPRRIKYEIVMADAIGAVGSTVVIGTHDEVAANKGIFYAVAQVQSLIISRDFTTDLETVCEELWAGFQGGAFTLSVRETILTPLPVDESP